MRPGAGGEIDTAVAGGTVLAGGAAILGASKSSHTGPIIAGAVALLVALITWFATDRRQAQQLAHDARQKELDGAHDRILRDLQELRSFLDDAAAAIEDYVEALTRYASLAEGRSVEEATQLRWSVLDASQSATVAARRLDLRVESGHPFERACWQTVQALDAAKDAVFDLPPWTPKQSATHEECRGQAMRRFAEFTMAARGYLGTRFGETEYSRLLGLFFEGHLTE